MNASLLLKTMFWILISSSGVDAEVSLFQDINLKNAVDKNTITSTGERFDILQVRTLDARDSEISKLDGIEKLVEIRSLQLGNNYIDEMQYRYYNVNFWLDLGVSMPKPVTKKVINFISCTFHCALCSFIVPFVVN